MQASAVELVELCAMHEKTLLHRDAQGALTLAAAPARGSRRGALQPLTALLASRFQECLVAVLWRYACQSMLCQSVERRRRDERGIRERVSGRERQREGNPLRPPPHRSQIPPGIPDSKNTL